ncbi:WbqC family protein [Flavobacteriaceae bacterium]|nr:WbqC family protein [Flavobacteriaceae bacterium]
MALFIPTYFSPISQYQALLNSNSITFEVEDNYQKQTYRNRCYIYGANGKQLLNIPVSIPKSTKKTKSKDILVENSNWQKQHYKSLEAAYNHSPFFEFYKDDLQKLFSKKYTYLLDVNLDSFAFIMEALELSKEYSLSKVYEETKLNDFRNLADSKKKVEISFLSYIQMFDQKFGFLKNLSILDLLFMEGPNSINFLKK